MPLLYIKLYIKYIVYLAKILKQKHICGLKKDVYVVKKNLMELKNECLEG